MRLNDLNPATGSRKNKKRVGRGNGSGHGTYSGRGCKGEKARAGFKIRPGFEGGQLPIIKRLPRQRGFINIFRVSFTAVNTDKLNIFEDGAVVTLEMLFAAGLVRTLNQPVKILATGDITKKLTIKAHKFSTSAKAKIEAAGGSVEEVAYAPEPE